MLYTSSVNSKIKTIWEYASFIILGSFWLYALMNPVFKKYDYGGELPVVVGFGVLLLLIAIVEFAKKRERNLGEQVLLMIFAAAFVLSFIFSGMRSFGLTEVMVFLSVITVYLLLANRKIEWMESFLKIVAVGGIFTVIVGGILYLTRGEVRMFGTFFNKIYPGHVWPNAFGLFLVMVWPLYIWLLKKRSWLEISFILGLVLSALLLSYSRGAVLVLCGQIVLLILYFFKRINFKVVKVVVCSLILGWAIFAAMNQIREQKFAVIDVSERVGFENHESLTSKQERVDFWKGAIELAKEKPFFGWGPFSFRYAYNGIQKEFLASSDHPHNIFLKIAAENGLIALGAFVLFLLLWFFTVVVRCGALPREERDVLHILMVAVAGTFAHNLIDYNLNFTVTILLLFLYLAFMRSLVVERAGQVRRAYIPLILAAALAILSLYEGVLFINYHFGKEEYMEKSLFPRYHYLTVADQALQEGQYDQSLEFLNRETELSPLSAQAWYLKGVIYCKEDYAGRDDNLCKENFAKALALNPMNDFNYYHDYFRQLEREKSPEIHPMIEIMKPLLRNYFMYVEFNVHFTSYTENVEVAAALIDSIVPYLSGEEAQEFIVQKEMMLKTAARQRTEKEF